LCVSLDPSERELGADVLGQLGASSDVMHEERLQTLLAMLERENEPNVLASTCMALGHLHDEKANESVMRFKGHPDNDVRYAVAHGLTGDLDTAAIATLIELSADADSDVRDWATFRLGTRIENPTQEVLDALAARVTDEDDDTRAEAIAGLARNKDPRSLEPLIEYLEGLEAGGEDWSYIEDLLYEAARELADHRLCPVLFKIKSAVPDNQDVDEALQKCGCEAT
jgi:HEAT repeat protein